MQRSSQMTRLRCGKPVYCIDVNSLGGCGIACHYINNVFLLASTVGATLRNDCYQYGPFERTRSVHVDIPALTTGGQSRWEDHEITGENIPI